MLSKGLRLQASSATKTYASQEEDEQIVMKYQELIENQRRLSKEYEKTLDRRNSVEGLVTKIELLEKELARASAFFRQEQAVAKIDNQAVQNSLKEGEAAIEFVHFQYQSSKSTDSILYAAAILLPNSSNASFIPLCNEQQLAQVLETKRSKKVNLINQVYAARGIIPTGKKKNFQQIYRLVWQPLDSLLSGVNTIYYSPTGLLHRLNMNALPIGNKQILADKYNLIQLSSTRSIALEKTERPENKTAYIVGGVTYDAMISTPSELITFDSTQITLAENTGYFSYTDRSLRGEHWNYLPGTKKESSAIKKITEKAGYTITYQEGNAATEAAFKELGTKSQSPSVIHLATHGFFFPDVKDSLRAQSKEPIFKISEHPMLRSGLLLAGANRVWEGAEALPDHEDGILTAMEISQMNLSNTDLVVLSACETGLGDIQGSEGVYGLQRAFKKAGAKYLIMSLWQVPDKETSIFMTSFYNNWLKKKMSIPEAFNLTQKEMRDRFPNPYQWAGFVLIE